MGNGARIGAGTDGRGVRGERELSGLDAMSIYITPRSDFLCHLVVIVSVVCYLLVCGSVLQCV